MLKSLELFGFKSFADRTVFEFDPGMTCVVGPNGSGKSNVVDSIKWILGDQSAKSLRGTEMTDVIFNGSNGRKPSGFSEASLTFDNSGGLFPLETAEVQVGRRLYRSGESEYLLNRNVVRLKDVRDLFLGTGAGTAAYSIIEQGRVDQILQANPAARRLVFEEAAGISRFKSRRIEAQRKIERIDLNLQRLTDIVDEAEAQLNSTRSQASKAAKFREVSTELKELWTGLAADDARRWTSQLSQLRSEEARTQQEAVNLEEQVKTLEEHARLADHELQEIESRVREIERRLASNRENIVSQESTIRHQSFRMKELHADLERLRRQRLEMTVRAAAVVQELQDTAVKLREYNASFQHQQQKTQGRDREISELRTLLEAARTHVRRERAAKDQLTLHIQAATTQIATLDLQRQTAMDNLSITRGKVDQLLAELSASQAELEVRRQSHEMADSTSQQAREQLELLRSERSSLLGEHSQVDRRLAELREKRSAALARLHVLQDLERKQEGIGLGVREILRRAETVGDPPWSNILGTVGDLLDTALDTAPLVELALGDRTQILVVDDLRPLLDYLNQGEGRLLDRVSFVELRSARDRHSGRQARQPDWLEAFDLDSRTWPDLSREPGVIQRADELVSEARQAQGLAARLLADTWIVSTLDRALQLAASAGQGCRFVTMQGELVTGEGVLVVGTAPQEAAVLSRKSELRKLRGEVVRIDRAIESDTGRLEALSKALASRTGRHAEIEVESLHHSSQAAEAALRLAAQQEEVQRVEEALHKLDAQAIEQSHREQAIESELQAVRARQESELTRSDELGRQVEQGETEVASLEEMLNNVQQLVQTEQVELVKQEERLRSLNETQSRLQADQDQRVDQELESHERYSQLKESEQDAILVQLRTQAQLAERLQQQEVMLCELRIIRREREAFRDVRARRTRELDEIHRRRRKAIEAVHVTQMKIREIDQRWSALAQRIEEEYQLTLEQLMESNASAFSQHLKSRSAGRRTTGNVKEDEDQSSAAMAEETAAVVTTAVDSSLHQNEDSVADFDGQHPHVDVVEQAQPIADEVTYEELRPELEAAVDRLRRRLKMMGHVNTDALTSLEEVETRYDELSSQLHDLQEAKTALEDIIRRINQESKRLFLGTFETIRQNFQVLFRKMFGGGEGNIILENPDDVLECGIDIVARPPGKELRSLTLLSGGEKTMTAVGLLFAMFKSKPSPYCILDEVDAALDDANVGRYVNVVREFASMTQFVVITHRKPTMSAADVLYGVTMEQAGVSKRMAVKFDQVGENGEILESAKAA